MFLAYVEIPNLLGYRRVRQALFTLGFILWVTFALLLTFWAITLLPPVEASWRAGLKSIVTILAFYGAFAVVAGILLFVRKHFARVKSAVTWMIVILCCIAAVATLWFGILIATTLLVGLVLAIGIIFVSALASVALVLAIIVVAYITMVMPSLKDLLDALIDKKSANTSKDEMLDKE